MTTKAPTVTGEHTETTFTVGQVADLLGVTVRTLHHYDGIGLVVPSERSRAGYRLYTTADLTRLQHVVVYRRLEFPLEQIATLLEEGATDPRASAEHLRRQRAAVLTRLDELRDLVTAIDTALEATMNDRPATREEMRDLFGDGFSDDYQAEAQERWGETAAWKQSAARTARYTKADWVEVKAEMAAVGEGFAAAMDAGMPPTSEAAMDAAEAHRASIERFYDCSSLMHRGLADMYLADPRFTKTYEDIRVGMAQYVHDAIYANSARRDA
ncbi:MAG: MerR family transcriptional regulator [Actinomycetales bacterium]|jgi:DNA-binding transcriptional MerR regulator|uniref:MerR family transcriptional regulator n=1 Tax=Candidatus Phosphoribacter hodrii TaxID=2953743 RepID=A0A935CCI0_9MICO|nr:MerR family transcriptional regulator [Candidatus Phosphoribacter hodrii]MBL0003582.1 MerR family transcriptional regulator [Candidatus Phosphoribacter hodrii]HQD03102.1 MerR family transcriptional regulator [Dermatophilaceae bacterium]